MVFNQNLKSNKLDFILCIGKRSPYARETGRFLAFEFTGSAEHNLYMAVHLRYFCPTRHRHLNPGIKMKLIGKLMTICLTATLTPVAVSDEVTEQVAQWRQSNEQQIVNRFADLLRIPNVAADEANIRRNAMHISRLMTDAGLSVRLLELEGSNPVVFAEKQFPAPTRP